MNKKDINKVFENLINKIKETARIDLSRDFSDGRINSIANEKNVINKIKEVFNEEVDEILEPNDRYWYDLAFRINGFLIPFNIKMTSKFGKDNVSSKSALFWTFFDIPENNMKNNFSWSEFKNIFNTYSKPSDYRDYYFLIINKNDPMDIFYTSFKQIQSISKNRNNLPFQANWDRNRELIERSDKDAFIFCFKTFYDSLQDLKEASKTLDDIEMVLKRNFDKKTTTKT